ncbi:hypothetical protein B566_EDAN006908 [Ephemera danica]|nr:hypothetical protein B566_EDAN006908 [Ephemera danica]
MSIEQFDQLVTLVLPRLLAVTDCINGRYLGRLKASMKVALTLRYLATGDSISSMATEFGMNEEFIQGIIKGTCFAITNALMPLYLKKTSLESCKMLADSFWSKYRLPNCLGAIQCRRLHVEAANNSDFEDYVVLLLASSDANYCFAFATIGIIGSSDVSDDENDYELDNSFDDLNIDDTNVPPPSPLPNTSLEFPHFFVTGSESALKPNMMTPISREHLEGRTEKALSNKLYNKRLSQVMGATENAFGLLAANWHIFHKKIEVDGKTVKCYVQTAICLHNFILKTNADIGFNAGPGRDGDEVVDGEVVVPGKWRSEQEGSLWEPDESESTESSVKVNEGAGMIRHILVQFLTDDVLASHNL